jgi:hypothetical protein
VKEAYAKAVGDGLARPLAGIEVGLAPPDAVVLHAVDGDPAAADRWTQHGHVPLAGYVGALIVEGRSVRQRGWALEPDAPGRQVALEVPRRGQRGLRVAVLANTAQVATRNTTTKIAR